MSDPVQSSPDTDPVGTVRACMDDIGNWLLAVREDVWGSRWSNYIGTYRHGNEPEGVDGWPWHIIGVIPGSPAAEAQQLRQDLAQSGADVENSAPPGAGELRQRVTAKLDQIESRVQALTEDERMDLRGRYLCGARDALMTVLAASSGGSELTAEGAERRAEARAHRRRSAAEIRALIERSSLGTPGAVALRKSASGAALTPEEQRAADAELAELEKGGRSDG